MAIQLHLAWLKHDELKTSCPDGPKVLINILSELENLELKEPELELALQTGGDAEVRLQELDAVLGPAQLRELPRRCEAVHVQTPVAENAMRVVQATRAHPDVQLGASPRAALAWLHVAKARALLDDRYYVLPIYL